MREWGNVWRDSWHIGDFVQAAAGRSASRFLHQRSPGLPACPPRAASSAFLFASPRLLRILRLRSLCLRRHQRAPVPASAARCGEEVRSAGTGLVQLRLVRFPVCSDPAQLDTSALKDYKEESLPSTLLIKSLPGLEGSGKGPRPGSGRGGPQTLGAAPRLSAAASCARRGNSANPLAGEPAA